MTSPSTAVSQTPDLDTLLDQLTLEEQVSLLAGADFWRTVPIERLNIPALKVSDGPAGARGGGALVGGTPTAAFPVGIALGASWNVELLREVGVALAREAHDKGAGVLLAPTINLFRSTLNGRNFESYAEDPYLTGQLAAAYVQGSAIGGCGGHRQALRRQRIRVPAQLDQLRHSRAGAARTLPAPLRDGRERRPALGRHEQLQQGQRHLCQRVCASAARHSARRVGLRRPDHVRLGRHLQLRRVAAGGPRPGDAGAEPRPHGAAGRSAKRSGHPSGRARVGGSAAAPHGAHRHLRPAA